MLVKVVEHLARSENAKLGREFHG